MTATTTHTQPTQSPSADPQSAAGSQAAAGQPTPTAAEAPRTTAARERQISTSVLVVGTGGSGLREAIELREQEIRRAHV